MNEYVPFFQLPIAHFIVLLSVKQLKAAIPSVSCLVFHSTRWISSSLSLPWALPQAGDVCVLQDLRLLLGLQQSVGDHCSRHALDVDGHGR